MNVVLIGVVERAGGNGVRLVVRNADRTPLADGRGKATLIPPAEYPKLPTATIARSFDRRFYAARGRGQVTLTGTNVTTATRSWRPSRRAGPSRRTAAAR